MLLEKLSNIDNTHDKTTKNIKIGQTIDFSIDDNDFRAKIMSRGGKVTGKFKNCFNVQYQYPSTMYLSEEHVDFDEVKSSKGDPSILYFHKNDKLSGLIAIQPSRQLPA